MLGAVEINPFLETCSYLQCIILAPAQQVNNTETEGKDQLGEGGHHDFVIDTNIYFLGSLRAP